MCILLHPTHPICLLLHPRPQCPSYSTLHIQYVYYSIQTPMCILLHPTHTICLLLHPDPNVHPTPPYTSNMSTTPPWTPMCTLLHPTHPICLLLHPRPQCASYSTLHIQYVYYSTLDPNVHPTPPYTSNMSTTPP